MSRLRVGARTSPLSRWQAERVRSLLHAAGLATEFVGVTTTGDLDRATPLGRFGQPAIFSRELDEALTEGRIDLAVHSLKDLPTTIPAGIRLAAVSAREDARDALVGRGPLRWADIPPGATIATSSLRRQAQLLRARPDLVVVDLRGNVGTRLETLDRTPEWTGILLATAGLVRLGLEDRIGERLPLELMLPAPGQGALAVTTRSDDPPTATGARLALNDAATEFAVAAERALLATVEGGCHLPVAAYAEVDELAPPRLHLRGSITSLDGREAVAGMRTDAPRTVAEAEAVGAGLAAELLDRGGRAILHAASAAGGAR